MKTSSSENQRRGVITINAIIIGGEGRETATLYQRTWTPNQRRIRAIKTFALWWGLALVSLFIPILHFVLVPLFLLIGLIAPPFVFASKTVILGGNGTCPFCGKSFEIFKCKDEWPLHDVCAECQRHVRIEKESK